MILYNMRFRGPLEYDKFVLNVLQFHNEVSEIILKEFDTTSGASLEQIVKDINAIYDTTVGKTQPGFSELLYQNMLDLEEC